MNLGEMELQEYAEYGAILVFQATRPWRQMSPLPLVELPTIVCLTNWMSDEGARRMTSSPIRPH